MQKIKSIFPVLVLFSILLVCCYVYWPGLNGGFIFDDFPNLKDLGAYGGVVDRESFRSFVFNGFSGPLGRPVSLASFLLDDNTWPSQGAWFKKTNLLIHLLCGVILCWTTLLLLRLHRVAEPRAQWLALFSSACWMLHPYQVSTVLYVVQRMAELSTLFVFVGIAAYLHGRILLQQARRRGYVWMYAAVGIATACAVLSKENGILLPLLLLVIEYTLPANDDERPNRVTVILLLWIPSLAILSYLGSLVDFSPNPWPNRNFNQIERLLTEPRILLEYLHDLYLPRIEGNGLYQDGYEVSRDLFSPWTSLPALLGVIALLGCGLWARRRYPLVALAILFFFAAHLIESTVVGLELYFEHRNYPASAFLFLPIAFGIDFLRRNFNKRLAIVVALALLTTLSFLTLQRATLWGDVEALDLYWAHNNPNSPRAQNTIATYLANHGRFEESEQHLSRALERMPDSALLNIRWLIFKLTGKGATAGDFEIARERLRRQPFDAQAVLGLRYLVEYVCVPNAPSAARIETLKLIDAMSSNEEFARFPLFVRLIPYLKGQLYLAEKDGENALKQYATALHLYGDVDASLQMVSEVASAGYIAEANTLLNEAYLVYRAQSDKSLKRSRELYDQEFVRLRELLKQ